MKPIVPLASLPAAAQDGALETEGLSGSKAWDSFRDNCRNGYDRLKDQLFAHQRGLCAYCEIRLFGPRPAPNRHVHDMPDYEIEHFHPKSQDQDGVRWVFEPGNLFLSCRNTAGADRFPEDQNRNQPPSSCGPFKLDRNPDAISEPERPLKPSELPKSVRAFMIDAQNGSIHPVNAEEPLANRLQATITFLNLDCKRLRDARRRAREVFEEEFKYYLAEAGDDFFQAQRTMAIEQLLGQAPNNYLPAWFSTLRDFLQPEAEVVLAAHPESWLHPAPLPE